MRNAAITAISLASLALGCSTLPAAFANFDFGDTQVEVRNKTEQNVDSGDFVTADSVRVGVHEFRVSFSFRRDRLWGIWLSGPEVEGEPRSGPEDYRESILDLYDILHARYGEPIDPSGRRPPRASLEVQFRTLGSRTARRSGCSTHWRWKTERKVVALSSCRRKEKAVAGKPGDSSGLRSGDRGEPDPSTFWYGEISIWYVEAFDAIQREQEKTRRAAIVSKGRLFR